MTTGNNVQKRVPACNSPSVPLEATRNSSLGRRDGYPPQIPSQNMVTPVLSPARRRFSPPSDSSRDCPCSDSRRSRPSVPSRNGCQPPWSALAAAVIPLPSTPETWRARPTKSVGNVLGGWVGGWHRGNDAAEWKHPNFASPRSAPRQISAPTVAPEPHASQSQARCSTP